ncbi:acyl-coenzyme A thioesterase 8 [Pholidichthys leucotaenia]
MAENQASKSSTAGVSSDYSGMSDVTEDPKPPEDQNCCDQDKQDLRSVLVTSVLNLEQLDVDLYRGTHHWVPRTQRLFGGQIVGQALVAAAKSVSDIVYAHSLHCYFVQAGDPKVPVLYQVDRTRDGKSFTVRSVKAIQHGQPIFICQASFQMLQPSPLKHQFTMPEVPQPEDLPTMEELIYHYLRKPDLSEKAKRGLNKMLANDVPIEIKPIIPAHFYRRSPAEPRRLFWGRARGYIGEGNMKLHCCVAAYISDFALLGTVLLPYPNYRAHFTASLDHSMWFHSTFRSDEWMLYECESSWAGSSRGLVHGRLWRRDGVLAASCSQEGVLRVKPVKEAKL